MGSTRQTDSEQTKPKDQSVRGLLRPPFVFLMAIVLGVALNTAWSLPFVTSSLRWIGPLVSICAALLFLLSVREFRAAGTSVQRTGRTTMIVGTGPYRFSRNPIYLAFILLVLGLSVWLNDLWLLVTLIPAIALLALLVIPQEERFLEGEFRDEYLSYKAAVRRWL